MKKILVSICIMLAAAAAATAQEFSTTYFLDNNLYSYRINPAIQGEKGFVGFAISNLNFSFGSNTGISSLLYPNPNVQGGLVTGLHRSISPETFLGNLPGTTRIDQTLNENLLAIGFRTEKAYHSIEVNIKEDILAGLPKDLFEMFKCGSRTQAYDLSSIRLGVKSYAEIAYGYSRSIGDKFTVGARVKFLAGLAAGSAAFDRGSMTVNGDEISYDIDARLRVSASFLDVAMMKDKPGVIDLSGFSFDPRKISPSGWGGALDLGLTYKPVENLTVSWSLLDVGGIAWTYNILGKSTGSDSFTGATIKSDGTIGEDLKNFTDKLQTLADFKRVSGSESSFEMLACTMHLGARYRMPFYDGLSVGLLATYRIDKLNPSFGARLGATLTPVKWLSITGNYGINTFCKTFGAAMSLNVIGLNLCLGYEGYSGVVSKVRFSDSIPPLNTPVGSFQNMLKVGLNITFGPRKDQ